MAARDYQICPALFKAYIAKVSKRHPNQMTDDRREITDGEIMMLIDWWLDKNVGEGKRGLVFDSFIRDGIKIEMVFKKKEEEKE